MGLSSVAARPYRLSKCADTALADGPKDMWMVSRVVPLLLDMVTMHWKEMDESTASACACYLLMLIRRRCLLMLMIRTGGLTTQSTQLHFHMTTSHHNIVNNDEQSLEGKRSLCRRFFSCVKHRSGPCCHKYSFSNSTNNIHK
mmetsp:Transcript_827/g.1974  ORF Transcript_827/g.1974 Transcript_827/m.1974 type:complete len:143 (+) Transcript_827:2004-2432(+)